MTRLVGYVAAGLAAIVTLYISRFWPWPLPWSRKGLWDIQLLSPNGDVVRRALRGTPFEALDLLIWLGLVFATLTFVQWLLDRFSR